MSLCRRPARERRSGKNRRKKPALLPASVPAPAPVTMIIPFNLCAVGILWAFIGV